MTVDLAPDTLNLGPIGDWLPQPNPTTQPDLDKSDLGDLDSWLSGAAGDTRAADPGSVYDGSEDGRKSEEPVPLVSRFQPLPKDFLSEPAPSAPLAAPPPVPSPDSQARIGRFEKIFAGFKSFTKENIWGLLGGGTNFLTTFYLSYGLHSPQ